MEDGFENPWEPAEYTFSSISGSAGDDTFLLEGIENFYLNMMIVGTVGVDDIFPPDTYISFIDLEGGTFSTSAPALVAFTSEDLTVGNYFIAEWTGTPVTWYDVSQGVVHGFNGRIATTRTGSSSFQECRFEFKLMAGQVITDITADYLRGDTDEVISSLSPITLADDATGSGILNAVISPDETMYVVVYLGNISFRISPYRNV